MLDDPMISSNLERVFLLPGEYHLTKSPKLLATLLGSCVAVCIKNTKNGTAAMNHYLHDIAPASDKSNIGRYGDSSILHMLQMLYKLDPDPTHYLAKIYGGGAVVSHLGVGMGIGDKNIRIAREILSQQNVAIVENKCGGNRGIKIYYNTQTFDVAVRPVGTEGKNFSKKNIRVLVVDDSATVRTIFKQIISQTEGMEVSGEAADAFEARDQILSLNPDVISLDIIMPRLDGLKFLEKIMHYKPIPVVIVSTIAKDNSKIKDKALTLGAVGVVDKDELNIYKSLSEAQRMYIPLLRTAALRNVAKR